jgi:hypothetical protein
LCSKTSTMSVRVVGRAHHVLSHGRLLESGLCGFDVPRNYVRSR